MIGQQGDAANHQYDTHDFFDAVSAGNFPSVSFMKAPGYQDGHSGYSDPLDEQTFVVDTINFLMSLLSGRTPPWSLTGMTRTGGMTTRWARSLNQSQTSAGRPYRPGAVRQRLLRLWLASPGLMLKAAAATVHDCLCW